MGETVMDEYIIAVIVRVTYAFDKYRLGVQCALRTT